MGCVDNSIVCPIIMREEKNITGGERKHSIRYPNTFSPYVKFMVEILISSCPMENLQDTKTSVYIWRVLWDSSSWC